MIPTNLSASSVQGNQVIKIHWSSLEIVPSILTLYAVRDQIKNDYGRSVLS